MTDWADEAVDELCKEFGFDEGKGLDIYDKQLVSQALRAAELRGRVAGMRECADWIEQIYGPDLANSFRDTASKLSPT